MLSLNGPRSLHLGDAKRCPQTLVARSCVIKSSLTYRFVRPVADDLRQRKQEGLMAI